MINEYDLRKACAESPSLKAVLSKLNLCISGSNYEHFKKKIKEYKIDISHFSKYKGTKKEKLDKETFKTYLTTNSTYSSGTWAFKNQLLKFGYLEYKCVKCGNTGEWQGQKLSLQLDHINGVRNDNRLENLQILCPNCHAQTDTYAGKNIRQDSKKCKCGKEILKRSQLCKQCNDKARETIPPISKEWLSQLVYMMSFLDIGKVYGVRDNTIRDWCKKYGIKIPKFERGFWLKHK